MRSLTGPLFASLKSRHDTDPLGEVWQKKNGRTESNRNLRRLRKITPSKFPKQHSSGWLGKSCRKWFSVVDLRIQAAVLMAKESRKVAEL